MPSFPIEASAFLLLFVRVGAVLWLLPVFGEEAVPGRLRLMIAIGMTAGLWGILGSVLLPLGVDREGLIGLVLAELLVGGAIGMVVRIMFQAAAMAGSIVSLQIGLSSLLIHDPAQGGQAPLLSKFVSSVATLVCLSTGVHRLWIGALVRSYAMFPPGRLPPAADFAGLAVTVVGKAMMLGIGMAAPMLVYGLVLNVAMGMAVRLAPAIQLFFILQPLTILFGLALFAVILGPALIVFADAMAGFIESGLG